MTHGGAFRVGSVSRTVSEHAQRVTKIAAASQFQPRLASSGQVLAQIAYVASRPIPPSDAPPTFCLFPQRRRPSDLRKMETCMDSFKFVSSFALVSGAGRPPNARLMGCETKVMPCS